jgi:murein DD-endopeptidase MepM/ murein hydrolase activator NlpD
MSRAPVVRSSVLLCLLFLLAASAAESAAADRQSPDPRTIRWQPAQPVNGSPILFTVKTPARIESLSGTWLDHKVFFSSDSETQSWYGIAGVSLETQAGKYALALIGKTADGKEISFSRQITIAKGKYRRIQLTVPKQFTQPSPEQLTEIKQEQSLKHEVFSRVDLNRQWAGMFLPPVKASVSDVFGTARVFNGSTQSLHQGLDYAVPPGTPVDALNRGTVLLARPLFFEGDCVVLDHGQGLLTIYMHLSKIEVKEGDAVAGGQEIALSGGTGRATGPHLHIAVRWQGIYVDPATLLSLKVP